MTKKDKIIRATIYCTITVLLVAALVIMLVRANNNMQDLSVEMKIIEGEVNFAKTLAMAILITISGCFSAKAIKLAR